MSPSMAANLRHYVANGTTAIHTPRYLGRVSPFPLRNVPEKGASPCGLQY